MVALRMPAFSCASVGSWPSRNRFRISSSESATASISAARAFAVSSRSAGISSTEYSAPIVSSCQRIAFISTRSIDTLKLRLLANRNMDRHRARSQTLARSSKSRKPKSAPALSILLMKQIRGTLYLSAWRHTVSDCGCTPCTASKHATAPSSTRRVRSTSAVKSTWPGVSMMLMRMPFQVQVVAAEVIVMPRSCSCSIQSMVAVPSCTSPIRCVMPV